MHGENSLQLVARMSWSTYAVRELPDFCTSRVEITRDCLVLRDTSTSAMVVLDQATVLHFRAIVVGESVLSAGRGNWS